LEPPAKYQVVFGEVVPIVVVPSLTLPPNIAKLKYITRSGTIGRSEDTILVEKAPVTKLYGLAVALVVGPITVTPVSTTVVPSASIYVTVTCADDVVFGLKMGM
jgi:hypothetical protein